MIQTATYHYTPAQLSAVFNEISATLFAGIISETRPKLLITAGVQSSGKTWLLEKTLLPSGQYNNYVRLYLPEYRSKHPQYQDMLKLGVLHAYEQTETFIRELCGKIFEKAFAEKLNIILECAFDSIDFATLRPCPRLLSAPVISWKFTLSRAISPSRFCPASSGLSKAWKKMNRNGLYGRRN
jgi:hypothetical protein